MFTVKVLSSEVDYHTTTYVHSCNSYSVSRMPDYTEVTLNLSETQAQTYRLENEDNVGEYIPYMTSMYVENINGKTIDHIRHITHNKP